VQIKSIVLLGTLLTITNGAIAQQYPSKPIRLVVGFAAGGPSDVAARTIAQKLTEKWGQQVIVDIRPGASGNIATEIVAKAPADGYTLLMGGIFNMVMNKALVKNLPYEPLRDFTSVGPATTSMLSFNVGPAVPATVKTLGDYVQWCKTNPDKASYGTTSAGATPHFAGVMLSNESKVTLNPVHLNIAAVPGAGNLLGNLLCAVAGLLNGGGLSGVLGQIASLLNQILALL